MVTFELFARPMIEALAGMTPATLAFLHAQAEIGDPNQDRPKAISARACYLESSNSAEVEFAAMAWLRRRRSQARANCYIVIPPDRERIAAGEWVAVMMR